MQQRNNDMNPGPGNHPSDPMGNITFGAYARRFFLWETCPHVARLQDEGKSITKRYVREQRFNLVNHMLTSELHDIPMMHIRRAHIIDFRSRLRSKGLAAATVNKIMSGLKVIFNEAEFRQDIPLNPATGVGKIKGRGKSIDIFSPEELSLLFPKDIFSVWRSRAAYTCFFLAASTGMRKGEILALTWSHIAFDAMVIRVNQAWKDTNELGLPKWEKERFVIISQKLLQCLLTHREYSPRTAADDLVFCYPDGSRFGGTWWLKNFHSALKKSGIDTAGRVLHPHCLRHTLATLMRASGENPEKIRASLGWADAETQDGYTHWKPDHLQHQGPLIDQLWESQ